MHITKSAEKTTPFGGFNFCLKRFHRSGLARLIEHHLGDRAGTVGFSYSDMLDNQMGIIFAGGDCAEDINEHLRGPLGQLKDMAVCSGDTILRGVKELSCPSQELVNPDSGAPISWHQRPPE